MSVTAGTGHTVGVTYACHYWGGTYEVIEAVGPYDVRVRWQDGHETTHGTRLDLDPVGHPNRDHPVGDACSLRLECVKRGREQQ